LISCHLFSWSHTFSSGFRFKTISVPLLNMK
jgi:hypothetical protein